MGSFWTAIHVLTEDSKAVVKAAEQLGIGPAYVLPHQSRWTSLYPEATEAQDESLLRSTAEKVSRETGADAIAVLVHDSDTLSYYLARAGVVVDEYDSDPGYFAGEDLPPRGGEVSLLLPLCRPGVDVEELQRRLHEPRDIGGGQEGFAPLTPDVLKSGLALMQDHTNKKAAEMRDAGLPDEFVQQMQAMMKQVAQEVPDLAKGMLVASDADELASFLEGVLGMDDGANMAGYRYISRGEGPNGARQIGTRD